jgi:hypothetical protein
VGLEWLSSVLTVDGRTYAHTTPVDDSIVHTETRDCECGPKFYQVLGNGAEYTWQVVHASLDGRELSE